MADQNDRHYHYFPRPGLPFPANMVLQRDEEDAHSRAVTNMTEQQITMPSIDMVLGPFVNRPNQHVAEAARVCRAVYRL